MNVHTRTLCYTCIYMYTSEMLGMQALWGERERSGRHYSDQHTVQHSVQQPGRSLLLSRVTQTGRGWIGSAVSHLVASLGKRQDSAPGYQLSPTEATRWPRQCPRSSLLLSAFLCSVENIATWLLYRVLYSVLVAVVSATSLTLAPQYGTRSGTKIGL